MAGFTEDCGKMMNIKILISLMLIEFAAFGSCNSRRSMSTRGKGNQMAKLRNNKCHMPTIATELQRRAELNVSLDRELNSIKWWSFFVFFRD